MKLATVAVGGGTRAALVEDERPVGLLRAEFRTVGDVIAAVGQGMADPYRVSEAAGKDVKVLAPLPRPARNIFCVGKNYHEHAHEFARSGFDSSAAAGAVPDAPIIFSKVPESVIAPGAAIVFDPEVSEAIDYEAELAVIIGKAGKRISRGDALAHVWGYTIVNDVTARDVQQRLKQWHVGKSFDTFCPMGPWLVTADELDGQDTRVRCWVNGELRQDGPTENMIFDIPSLIETCSRGITLLPGDIIATGTPSGVGMGMKPPVFLAPGDRVRIEIDGIGVLESRFIEQQGDAR